MKLHPVNRAMRRMAAKAHACYRGAANAERDGDFNLASQREGRARRQIYMQAILRADTEDDFGECACH